jgi:hypothetical protein
LVVAAVMTYPCEARVDALDERLLPKTCVT